MKLLPEQVETLRENLNKLVSECNYLREIKRNESKNVNWSNDGFSDVSNYNLSYEITILKNKIREIESVLNECNIVEEISTDIISIGSEFTSTIDFFGEEETQTFVLVDKFEEIEGKEIVSVHSPFGAAVNGKSINESFSYAVRGNVFNGVINEIIPPKQKVKTIVK